MDEIPIPLRSALQDRYRLDRELGRGGMAMVYLAHDLRHDKKVAVKVLRPELAASVGSERFLREVRLSAGLHHPHILLVFDSEEAPIAGGDASLFCVMPYVEGETLRARIEREKRLPVDDVLRIADLATYLATNPQDRANVVKDDTWWFSGLRDDARFKDLVRTR